MSAKLLTGKEAAASLYEEIRPKVKELDPKLVIVQVGEEAASKAYVGRKIQACENVGMRYEHRMLNFHSSFEELLEVLEELNADNDVTGIIVQLPLPPHLSPALPLIHRAIHPKKDVDGFTAYNLGKMFLSTGFEHLPPATPAGIIALLSFYDIPLAGKHVVIVGRSNIAGKPLSIMCLNRDATVTMCHSKTVDLGMLTVQADILVCAVGKPKMITKDMVKKGAVVIDVGITRDDGGLVGDVDFDEVKEVAGAITPVPGGVGPMTVASVMKNTVTAKERQG
ncbi:bifunctional 5,10-methylene-tetrahydrofolate dehydrogenase/5,10-methylene-tetrahydrofolate cyclohydrolase [Candidatus Peregrinibacteria bacterium CG10_big_fil_rev_8_21_14_0_10_49_16]|nr:MAG: bifunctional 5,10-methylene-tetrahydrofolate dehydrogenase/5,10-methylene-tetrahydrofolate cyclohydrolase [Candidatus Peregrinibacteria bacterium CG10_big_fil_rev_8_21_14_0_10_49_16]